MFDFGSARNLKTIIDNLPFAIVLLDVSMNMSFCSGHYLQWMKKTSAEVTGKTWYEIQELADKMAECDAVLLEKGGTRSFSVSYAEGGQASHLRVHEIALRDGHGTPTALLCVMIEITDNGPDCHPGYKANCLTAPRRNRCTMDWGWDWGCNWA